MSWRESQRSCFWTEVIILSRKLPVRLYGFRPNEETKASQSDV